MSDNKYTPYQPSMDQSYSRPRLNPDPASDIPSMRDNQFNPLMRDLSPVQSSLPRFPAASLSHGEVLRQIHVNSPASHPASCNFEVQRTASSSSTRAALLSHTKPRSTWSNNASLKRDFDSAFEGDSSLGQSVERVMVPQTGVFPDITKDDRRGFLLQQPREDFEHQCRMQTLILRSQIGELQAILDLERRSKEQVQASLEEERKLRKEADQRVKELEEKFVAVDQQTAQEQGHHGMEPSVKVNTGLEANVESQEYLHWLLEPASVEREREQEKGPDAVKPMVKVSTGLNANTDEHQENLHVLGDWILEPAAVEREQQQGHDGVEPSMKVNTGLGDDVDEDQEFGDHFWTVDEIIPNAWDNTNE